MYCMFTYRSIDRYTLHTQSLYLLLSLCLHSLISPYRHEGRHGNRSLLSYQRDTPVQAARTSGEAVPLSRSFPWLVRGACGTGIPRKPFVLCGKKLRPWFFTYFVAFLLSRGYWEWKCKFRYLVLACVCLSSEQDVTGCIFFFFEIRMCLWTVPSSLGVQ